MGLHTYLELKSVPKNIARILICYDALLQLRQKKVVAKTGTYVVARNVLNRTYRLPNSEQVDIALGKANKCEACALGTIFIARTRIFNQLKVKDAGTFTEFGEISGSFISQDLLTYFDMRQLDLIEGSFEGGKIGYCGDTLSYEDRKLVCRFANKYKTVEARLIAILKNIISNDGTFIPEKNFRKRKKKVDKKETVVKQNQGE